METYHILLYYKYVPIPDPVGFIAEHRQLCASLDLKGRIYVAGEGINGTVSGLPHQTDAYQEAVRNLPGFETIDFKTETWHQHAFPRLTIKVRPEIVALKAGTDLDPNQETGTYLEPADFDRMLESDPDVVVLDTRNDYEYAIGHFKGAVESPIRNFRDFPDMVEKLKPYRDKKILAYCTGGIRCEKATALLKRAGFNQVFQLHGGIIRYGQITGGKNWLGKCYVFDERIAVPVNQFEETVISTCRVCNRPSDRYINCSNASCNEQILVCESCEPTIMGACSAECARSPMSRWGKKQESPA